MKVVFRFYLSIGPAESFVYFKSRNLYFPDDKSKYTTYILRGLSKGVFQNLLKYCTKIKDGIKDILMIPFSSNTSIDTSSKYRYKRESKMHTVVKESVYLLLLSFRRETSI